MTDRRALRSSVVPLLLLASGSTSRCELSTDSGTGELHITGTVRFLEVGAGCWQLDTGDRRYELLPEQAPPSVLRDGARVSLVGQPAEGPETGCRVGMPFAVRRVVSVLPSDRAG